MSPEAIAQVAQSAGFSGQGLVNAVAVALAESGGDPKAENTNSDQWHSRDRGLWQINDHWHPGVTDAMAYDPAQCAAAAYQISSGGMNWSPWSTWHNGRAQRQLKSAQAAVASLGGSTPSGGTFAPQAVAPKPSSGGGGDLLDQVGHGIDSAANAVGSGFDAAGNAIGNAGSWVWNHTLGGVLSGIEKDIYEGAVYFGVILLGGGLIVVGANAISKKTGAGQAVGSTIGKAAMLA